VKEHWSLSALREYTQQPVVYLKEVLNEVCTYNKKVHVPHLELLACQLAPHTRHTHTHDTHNAHDRESTEARSSSDKSSGTSRRSPPTRRPEASHSLPLASLLASLLAMNCLSFLVVAVGGGMYRETALALLRGVLVLVCSEELGGRR
jgi:hypothetical protein